MNQLLLNLKDMQQSMMFILISDHIFFTLTVRERPNICAVCIDHTIKACIVGPKQYTFIQFILLRAFDVCLLCK